MSHAINNAIFMACHNGHANFQIANNTRQQYAVYENMHRGGKGAPTTQYYFCKNDLR
jgi:hypothetical protein